MKGYFYVLMFFLLTFNLFSITDCDYWRNKNENSCKSSNNEQDITYQLAMKWNGKDGYFDFSFNELNEAVIEMKKYVPYNFEKKSFIDRDYYESDINKYTKNNWYMYWNKFLPDEYHNNFHRVDYMIKYLKNEARKNKWSRKTLMMSVISHLQAIIYIQPRNYINDWRYGAYYFDYFSPNEIALFEKGDCDTKSIFIAIILNRLGFDSVCFISREYLHAMAGIHTKSNGRFLLFNNKKYYFLESTFPDWQIGDIPNGCENLSCWNVLNLE